MFKPRLLKFLFLSSCVAATSFHAPIVEAQRKKKKKVKASAPIPENKIRVIKNRYFQKRFRPEVYGGVSFLMNSPFVTSFYLNAEVNFHFSEYLGIYGIGAFGITTKKSVCEELGNSVDGDPPGFNVSPNVIDYKLWYGAGVKYTPIYGKFQLTSGDVLYFDWMLLAGVGLGSIESDKRFCSETPNSENTADGESSEANEKSSSSPLYFEYGTGQRLFFSQSLSVNWSIRGMTFLVEQKSSDTDENGQAVQSSKTSFRTNVLLSLGVGYFF